MVVICRRLMANKWRISSRCRCRWSSSGLLSMMSGINGIKYLFLFLILFSYLLPTLLGQRPTDRASSGWTTQFQPTSKGSKEKNAPNAISDEFSSPSQSQQQRNMWKLIANQLYVMWIGMEERTRRNRHGNFFHIVNFHSTHRTNIDCWSPARRVFVCWFYNSHSFDFSQLNSIANQIIIMWMRCEWCARESEKFINEFTFFTISTMSKRRRYSSLSGAASMGGEEDDLKTRNYGKWKIAFPGVRTNNLANKKWCFFHLFILTSGISG